jgi:hypothetical protein
MNARDALRELQVNRSDAARSSEGTGVMFDDRGKLLLPEVPPHNEPTALSAWLTAVFNLDARHPIVSGQREGLRGPDGHAVLARSGAPSIRFEPVSRINNPTRLIETLSWQSTPTDGAVHALKADHCRLIAHVVRMLCGNHEAITEAQEAEAIVCDLMSAGEPVDGHTTYGTAGQRYEAASALRRMADEVTGRRTGPARYLVDSNTGELVIAVGDLQETARHHVGSSLPRGWLDARMQALGWDRITLAGYGQPGRAGRKGPHARIFAFRGLLSAAETDQQDQQTP